MKPGALIQIIIILFALFLSPAVLLAAAGDHSGGGHGGVDVPGQNMDMPGHHMDMPGHSTNMSDHNIDIPGNGGGHNPVMEHGGSATGTTGNSGSHENGSHGGHNSRQGQGGSNVNGSAVLGSFGLVNGLIILSAALLKRKSPMTGGN